MTESSKDEPLDILAMITTKNGLSASLKTDGYWYGSQDFAKLLNDSACWKHWGPQFGDAAAWSVETACGIAGPGHKLTTFFGLEEIGSSVGDDGITP